MPKSKKARIVHLTKTVRKTREDKGLLISKIKKLCKTYTHIYVITVENERNQVLKDLRKARSNDVFVFGNNRVISKALGTDKKSECIPGIKSLAKIVSGHIGLVFSDSGPKELISFFDAFECTDYARCGVTVSETVTLPEGQLFKIDGEEIPHYMEEHLRGLGMPTKLDNGKVVLVSEHVVCTKGQKLDPDQAKILKHIGIRMSKVRVQVLYVWINGKVYNTSEWPKIIEVQ